MHLFGNFLRLSERWCRRSYRKLPYRRALSDAGVQEIQEKLMGKHEEKTSESHPIRVDFLPPEALKQPGRLGITFAPGKKVEGRWERDLEIDLRRLKEEYHAEVLVSLIERSEYSDLRIPDLFQKAKIWVWECSTCPSPTAASR